MSAMDDDDLGLGVRKVPKVAKVKNKTPAPVQITAEQLLREAKERELELVQPPPKQKIADEAELKSYQMRKRKAFEDGIRKNRSVIVNWIKYASWEDSQHALRNARSVYERALDVDHRNITIWLKYAEMEMKNKQINSARNVWDRAVTILPRANQFWYKYTYMEEHLDNIPGARQVYERWMDWEPDEQAWHSYINFELRRNEIDRARIIYERFVLVHPTVKNWIKYAKFEEKKLFISSARQIYERGVEYFGDEHISEELFIAFAKFEESQKEHERARIIYKYALDHLPKDKCELIYKQFAIHEKKFGSRAAIEDVIVSKRKFAYEEDLRLNPFNYDTWFDYLRMLENDGSDKEQVRMIYERAIGNVPPSREKRHWRRYIYLWINYALYEELECCDAERTREVYKVCLDLIPHKVFTFAKIWIMAAMFEVRQKNLAKARRIMGHAIGQCPKEKLFRGYIDLELQLREFQRCRILYEKFLEFGPENCRTWMKYAELEGILGDVIRARAIYELAISQARLDMPEVLWKGYIDFEVDQQEFTKTADLYRRLLTRTSHVKVWISFAKFELSVGEADSVDKCRQIYREANKALKQADEKEERLMLLEDWNKFEMEHGTEKTQADVRKLLPNKVKRRQKIQTETGAEGGWEEFYDYIFPDDQSAAPNLKLLAIAKNWKNFGTATLSAAPELGEPSVTLDPQSLESGGDVSADDDDDAGSTEAQPGVPTEGREFVGAGNRDSSSPKLNEVERKHDSDSDSSSSDENETPSVAVVKAQATSDSSSKLDDGGVREKEGEGKPNDDDVGKLAEKILNSNADKGEVKDLENDSSSSDDEAESKPSEIEAGKSAGKRSRGSSTSDDETKNKAVKQMRAGSSSSSSSSSSDDEERRKEVKEKQSKNRSNSPEERRARERSSPTRKSSRGRHSPEKRDSPRRKRSRERRKTPERRKSPGSKSFPERKRSPKRVSRERETRREPVDRSGSDGRSAGRRASPESRRRSPQRRSRSPDGRRRKSPERRRRHSPERRSRSPPRKRSPTSSRALTKRASPEARKPVASRPRRSPSSSSSSSDD